MTRQINGPVNSPTQHTAFKVVSDCCRTQAAEESRASKIGEARLIGTHPRQHNRRLPRHRHQADWLANMLRQTTVWCCSRVRSFNIADHPPHRQAVNIMGAGLSIRLKCDNCRTRDVLHSLAFGDEQCRCILDATFEFEHKTTPIESRLDWPQELHQDSSRPLSERAAAPE
jgi:hypothetical protein